MAECCFACFLILCALLQSVACCSVCHVEVKGKPLSPAFGVEIHEPSGEFVLKNDVQAKLHSQPPENESVVISAVNLENMRDDMLPVVNLNVEGIEEEYEWEEEQGSDDEYFL